MDLSAGIEANRKGDFTIRLRGVRPGSKVKYELSTLDFGLGSVMYRSHFILPQGDADRKQYLEKFEKYFNSAMILVLWHLTEPERNRHTYEPYLAMCRWLRENGKRLFGHAVFYGWDGLDDCDPADVQLDFIQPWVRALSREELERSMQERLRRCLDHFGPYMNEFVLNNEVLGKYGTDPGDWFSRKLGFRSLTPYFHWAHEARPSFQFYLNENSILGGANTPLYVEMIRRLLDEGARVGGIGIQGHFFGDRVPPAEQMWEKLEKLSVFGLPIRVTEFGVKATNPDLHAEDMLRLLHVCFAHRSVIGVNFWNFWEPDMWPGREARREAHLWNGDWTPRPAADAFVDLVTRQWTTQGTATTNAQGEITFRGFFGRYRIEVGGKQYTADLTAENRSAGVAAEAGI